MHFKSRGFLMCCERGIFEIQSEMGTEIKKKNNSTDNRLQMQQCTILIKPGASITTY